jgi:hypothetical protein
MFWFICVLSFLFFHPLFLHFLVTFLISFCYIHLPVSVVTHDVTRHPWFDLQSERYSWALRSKRTLHNSGSRLIWPHCFQRGLKKKERKGIDDDKVKKRRSWERWGGRKRIILLQNSQASSAFPSNKGSMEVKTARWLEVETKAAAFWFSELMSN